MKLLDKIAFNRLLNMLLNFILMMAKILKPKDNTTIKPDDKKDNKRWFPRIRKNNT